MKKYYKHPLIIQFLLMLILTLGWVSLLVKPGMTHSQIIFISISFAVLFTINSVAINLFWVPAYLYKKLYLFALLFLLTILISGSLLGFLQYGYKYGLDFDFSKVVFSVNWIFPYYIAPLFVAGISLAFHLFVKNAESAKRLEQVHKDKAATELAFLKSQMNPHFLINSLNTIYFQIDKANTGARDTLMKFSQLLRYQLYECNTDMVPVEKEVEYIKNYVALQSLRKGDKYLIDFETDNELRGFYIAPLVLISFVENAFKHVSTRPGKDNIVSILLSKNKEQILFRCYNTKDAVGKIEAVEYGGIGLENTKRRLELLYGKKYDLKISNDKDAYTVNLTIEL